MTGHVVAPLMSMTREIAASKAAAGLARSLVASHLLKWSATQFTERAVSIMGELFINAARVSGPAGTVLVHLRLDRESLWIAVEDGSPDVPSKRATVSGVEDLDRSDTDEFGGWGLTIIETLADEFWVEPSTRPGYKWVCARLHHHLPREETRQPMAAGAGLDLPEQGAVPP
jgi:anti-sigma regulatory factor (Ser/Thr protein kinase)